MVVDAPPVKASRSPVEMHAARGSSCQIPLGSNVRGTIEASELVPRVRVAVARDAPLRQLLRAEFLAHRRCSL